MVPITEDKFWSRVRRGDSGKCWPWSGRIAAHGYGTQHYLGKQHLAHRVAFFFANGRWPDPCCLHRCDNPPCCNPAHLFEGTHTENMADMTRKGRRGVAAGDKSGRHTKPHRTARHECNGRAKLGRQQVRDIRANYALCRVSQPELARRYGVSKSLVGAIVTGKLWTNIGWRDE